MVTINLPIRQKISVPPQEWKQPKIFCWTLVMRRPRSPLVVGEGCGFIDLSGETMAYLATRPGRFEYVRTPKHAFWLNLIECAFSKMACTFLRHIRVASVEELKARILKGVHKMNATPVVFRWKKPDLGPT